MKKSCPLFLPMHIRRPFDLLAEHLERHLDLGAVPDLQDRDDRNKFPDSERSYPGNAGYHLRPFTSS
jgi:hypothetical protein